MAFALPSAFCTKVEGKVRIGGGVVIMIPRPLIEPSGGVAPEGQDTRLICVMVCM